MAKSIEARVRALEKSAGMGNVTFLLNDGTRGYIPHRLVLGSMLDVIKKKDSPGARVMLKADPERAASDGSLLHSLALAMHHGPVAPGEVNG
jgi:hypothetical protein